MSTDRWRMLRADSLIALRDLPDASVDALITDPPYSSGGQFRGDRQAASSAKYVNSETATVYHEIEGDLVGGSVRVGDLPGKAWSVRLVPGQPHPQPDADTRGPT